MPRNAAILAVVAVIAMLLGTIWFAFFRPPDDAFAECRGSVVAGGLGALGGPFELVDETGKTVTDKDVITGPSLVYFGYTFCPDVCPLDNARNAEAIDKLEALGHEVTPVFISIDPKRDTPETMADFTDLMHPRMIGLTGSEEQVQAASRAYKTYFKRHDDEDPEYYLVDHTTLTYLVFPEMGTMAYFNRDVSAEEIAKRTACFIEAQ